MTPTSRKRPGTDPPTTLASRASFGADAEGRALAHLESHGLALVARNWRAPGRRRVELDLVMRDGDVVVIVEVRAHRVDGRGFAGHPAHTIGPEKQRRLGLGATYWLQQQRVDAASWRPRALRFDAVTLVRDSDGRWDIRWIKRAFETSSE